MPYSHQHKKDGSPIGGATSANLSLTNASDSDNGSYTVEVSQDGGPVKVFGPLVLTIPAVDADASSYIANVEAADGQALEPSISQAINDFIVGCKADGNWVPIAQSCIMMGARTLAGALIPLRGSAPINNNFITGDYSRSSGLTGNGVDKNLDTGRLANADALNDVHRAVYVTGPPDTGGKRYLSAPGTLDGLLGNTTGFRFRANSSTLFAVSTGSTIPSLIGYSRYDASNVDWIGLGQAGTVTNTSTTAETGSVTVFSQGNLNFLETSLSFYAVGAAINLPALQTRLNTLHTAIAAEMALSPTFTLQPQTQTITEGDDVVFSGTATGTGTVNLKLQRDIGAGFVDVAGATSATGTLIFTVTNVQLTEDGDEYRIVATDDNGTTNSSVAVLSVTALVIPTFATFFRDTFTEASDTSLELHTPDVDVLGSGWSILEGTAVVMGGLNYVNFSDGVTDDEIVFNSGEVDQVIIVDISLNDTSTNRTKRIKFRRSDANNYYSLVLNQTASESLQKLNTVIGGVITEIDTSLFEWLRTTTYRVLIALSGNSIKIYVNGQLQFDLTDSSLTGTGFAFRQNPDIDGNRLLGIEAREPLPVGLITDPQILATPDTGKRLTFFIAGMTSQDIQGFSVGKSGSLISVLADGVTNIGVTYVSSADFEDGVIVSSDLDQAVLTGQTLTLTCGAGLIQTELASSLPVSAAAVTNGSLLTSQPGQLSAAVAASSTEIDLTITLPAGSWGTITPTVGNILVWSTAGYGPIAVSTAAELSNTGIEAVIRLGLDRTIHSNEIVDIELLDGAFPNVNGNTLPGHWRAARAIDMSLAAAPPATTTVVSSGRSAVTLSVAKPVSFSLEGIPCIEVGEDTVNVVSSWPAETTGDFGPIHGAWHNPNAWNTQPYDGRPNVDGFNAANQAAYPLPVSKHDSFVKARSAADPLLEGASVIHPTPIEWWGYFHFVDTAFPSTALAPPIAGYDGIEVRPIFTPDLDQLMLDLPSLAQQANPPDIGHTLNRITQPNHSRIMGENEFYRHLTNAYITPGDGYGLNHSEAFAPAYLHLISDVPEAEKREAATWMMHHGLQLYYSMLARGQNIVNNGGHEQGYLGCLGLALGYTDSPALLSSIRSVVGMNELQQTFLWEQEDHDRITNRTNWYAIGKTVTAVTGARVDFSTGSSFEVENGYAQMLLTNGVGEWEVIQHTRFNTYVTLDTDAHGLQIGDEVWFKIPFPVPALGTPDWSVRAADQQIRMAHHAQTYRGLNKWSSSLMMLESVGLVDDLSWPAWQLECRAANNDPNYLAPGYKSSTRFESTYVASFWEAHNAATLALSEAATAVRFGTNTPIGEGGIAVGLADGTYGEFTVASGVMTPNTTPLTVGAVTHGGLDISVEAGSRTVSTWDELSPILDTSYTGIVYLRPGTYDNSAFNFYGKQLTLTNATFQADDPTDRPFVSRWRWAGPTDPSFSGFTFKQLKFNLPHPSYGTVFGIESVSEFGQVFCDDIIDDVTFDDCDFSAGLLPSGSGGVMMAASTGIHFDDKSSNVTIKNCRFQNMTYGAQLGTNGFLIEDCEFRFLHADAVGLFNGARNGIIRNNLSADLACDASYYHADFIQLYPADDANPIADIDIYGNVLWPSDYIGVAFAQGDPAERLVVTESTSFTVDDTYNGKEIRVNPTADMVVTLPGAVASHGKNFPFRRTTGANGFTVTFVLDGSDTYELGTPEVLSSAGEVRFVSDGTSVWKDMPSGRRSNDYIQRANWTIQPFQKNGVIMIDTTDGNVSLTMHGAPVDGEEYCIRRVYPATGTATLTMPMTIHGGDVSSLDFPMGYSVDAVYSSATSRWLVTEDSTGTQGFFGNRHPQDLYSNFKFHGNILMTAAVGVRIESNTPGMEVFNNTVAQFLYDDINGDGIVGSFEGNKGRAGDLDIRGNNARGWSNITTGAVTLTNGDNSEVATDVGSISLNVSDTTTFPAGYTSHFAGANKAAFRPATRLELIDAVLAKANGPLDGTFIGACGTTRANGYYNWETGAVNTAGLPAPSITSSTPADGGILGLDGSIAVVFNQFIHAGTGNVVLRNVTGSLDEETFNVATGTGSNGGTVTFANRTLTITPGSNLTDTRDYSIRIAATAVVGHYDKAFAGIVDDTTLNFTADDIPTEFLAVNTTGGYLTRASLTGVTGTKTKAIYAWNAVRDATGDALGYLMDNDASKDTRLNVTATGEIRFALGSTTFRIPTAIPTSGARETCILTVDTAAATIAEGVKYYRDGTLVPTATFTSVVWVQNSDIDFGVNNNFTIFNNDAGTTNSFHGEIGFVYFDLPATLPDADDSAIRAKFTPGLMGADGSGPSGTAPLVYITGAASVWNAGTNLGTGGNFTQAGAALTDVGGPPAPSLFSHAIVDETNTGLLTEIPNLRVSLDGGTSWTTLAAASLTISQTAVDEFTVSGFADATARNAALFLYEQKIPGEVNNSTGAYDGLFVKPVGEPVPVLTSVPGYPVAATKLTNPLGVTV